MLHGRPPSDAAGATHNINNIITAPCAVRLVLLAACVLVVAARRRHRCARRPAGGGAGGDHAGCYRSALPIVVLAIFRQLFFFHAATATNCLLLPPEPAVAPKNAPLSSWLVLRLGLPPLRGLRVHVAEPVHTGRREKEHPRHEQQRIHHLRQFACLPRCRYVSGKLLAGRFGGAATTQAGYAAERCNSAARPHGAAPRSARGGARTCGRRAPFRRCSGRSSPRGTTAPCSGTARAHNNTRVAAAEIRIIRWRAGGERDCRTAAPQQGSARAQNAR